MRTLISTFGKGDEDKVLLAMRHLSYDRLVLVGDSDFESSRSYEKIVKLEEMTGHEVESERVGSEISSFMELVEDVSEVLARHAAATVGSVVILNISGGSKLLGDAALFAAFRHGVEAYHCDGDSVVRLPVMKGATAKDMFTEGQAGLIACLSKGPMRMDEAMGEVESKSRQALERIVRELRKAEIVHAELVEGRVVLSLTEAGTEVAKAVLAAES